VHFGLFGGAFLSGVRGSQNRAAWGGGALFACSHAEGAPGYSELQLSTCKLDENWVGGSRGPGGTVATGTEGGAVQLRGRFLQVIIVQVSAAKPPQTAHRGAWAGCVLARRL
jgi:hypothetical protein